MIAIGGTLAPQHDGSRSRDRLPLFVDTNGQVIEMKDGKNGM